MRICQLLMSVVVLALSTWAYAHSESLATCTAPQRPFDDRNDLEWNRFLGQIEVFRSCIAAQTDRHRVAIAEHQASTRASVNQWNEFVETSLNAPEDFPMPANDERAERHSF